VGGAAETYWKSSTSTPGNVLGQPEKTQVGRLSQNSPRNLNLATPPASNNLMTSSSLSGEYLPLSVQVTRDLIPVVSDSAQIPKQIFALGVTDVSYGQLATFLGSAMTGRLRRKSGHTRGYDFPPFLKLQDALEVCPFLAPVPAILNKCCSNSLSGSMSIFKSYILAREILVIRTYS
jgi:hypothetical protein